MGKFHQILFPLKFEINQLYEWSQSSMVQLSEFIYALYDYTEVNEGSSGWGEQRERH